VAVDPPVAPKRPDVPAGLDTMELGDSPLGGARLERVHLRSLALEERAMPDVRIEESRLDGVALDGCEAAGLTLTDVVVAGGSWANLRAVRGSLNRVEATELRATGADFAEAELRDARFEGCRLDLASFRFARLVRVAFLDCRLEEADFTGATLSSVRFERCGLGHATFENASFSQSELRACEWEGIAGAGSLAGTRIPVADALQLVPALAAAAGIQLVED